MSVCVCVLASAGRLLVRVTHVDPRRPTARGILHRALTMRPAGGARDRNACASPLLSGAGAPLGRRWQGFIFPLWRQQGFCRQERGEDGKGVKAAPPRRNGEPSSAGNLGHVCIERRLLCRSFPRLFDWLFV